MSRRQLFKGTATLIGAVLAAKTGTRQSWAATSVEREAEQTVTRLVEHVLQLVDRTARNQARTERLMAAIESQTDLGLLARLTLARHWRTATPEQREAFVGLFKSYLLRSFSTRLSRYAGTDFDAARQRFKLLSTNIVNAKDVVVRSRILSPDGAPLTVDWRLRQRGGRTVIIDLVVEGVSMLVTQRAEFSAVVSRVGVDGLIKELRGRVADLA